MSEQTILVAYSRSALCVAWAMHACSDLTLRVLKAVKS